MSQEVMDGPVASAAADTPGNHDAPQRWTIEIDGELRVRVPASLELMTPYVLLEQERWFETEIDFIARLVQPGWHVLDIGANYGMYTLVMAKAVGPTGRVLAFEPSSATADCLAESCALNGFDQVRLKRCALADEPGRGVLSADANTELGHLTNAADTTGHAVEIDTLDNLASLFDDSEIAFVKMDAEGAEERILAGAGVFLKRHAPVFMFEIKHANAVNQSLIAAFRAQGYHIYRHVPGLNALVTHRDSEDLDGYQLNCFAVPPSREQDLAARGLIADADAAVPEVPADGWLRVLDLVPAGPDLRQRWHVLSPESTDDGWAVHRDALNLMMFARDLDQPIALRYAALQTAVARLRNLVQTDANVSRLCTLARGMLDLGQRAFAVQLIQHVGKLLTGARRLSLPEPLIPLTAGMEGTQAHLQLDNWLYLGSLETVQRAVAFSGYFALEAQISLGQSATNFPSHSAEAERRLALASLRKGDQFPLRCRGLAQSGRNAALWAELSGADVRATADARAKTEPPLGLAPMLRPETNIVIADVGAMLVGDHPPEYSRLLDAGVASIVGFEPDPQEHARLQRALPSPHTFHRAFVGSGGPATYYETASTMTGSLYRPNAALLANYADLSELVDLVACHPVETSTLDAMLGDTDIDMIKIDVQGAELDVFKGGTRALANAVLVHTEVEFAELYQGQPLFGDIDRYLNDAGFQFLKFEGMSGRSQIAPGGKRMPSSLRPKQVLWADAVYVPRITALADLTTDKLIKLACITHVLYRADDLAWRALSELDQRDGSRRAERFVDWVTSR